MIDPINRRFLRGSEAITLEAKIFSVILELLSRPNELISREQLLDVVWGHRHVTPSSLNRAIAIARRAFGDDAGSAAFIQTVHGIGYRFVAPVERHTLPTIGPQARFSPPLTARPPARLSTFVGRDGDLQRIANALTDFRAVTLVGPGGMGKTQCALEYARRNEQRYADGIWCIDLSGMQHGHEMAEALAVLLGISGKDHVELMVKLSQELTSRRMLLILDNCDRIATTIGAVAVELLRQTEHLRVLATSQRQLDCVGERVLRLPPLTLPDNECQITEATLSIIADNPAVALLVSRVEAVQPNFALTLQNAPHVISICRHLDGMPLAIELAAARFSLLSAEQVLTRLKNRFRFLISDVAGRDSRHQTLEALFDWSFGLLSPEEQRLLCRLGVFMQGWSIEIAEEMSLSMNMDPGDFVDLLSGLVNNSLVAVDMAEQYARYKLLESTRDFALRQLAARGEEDLAREAHLKCIRNMARRAHEDMLSPRMSARIASLKVEHSNIDAALDYAQRSGDEAAALEIFGSLLLYIKSHGVIVDGVAWSERVLKPVPNARTSFYARALLARGIVELHLRRSPTAADHYLGEACVVAGEVNDRWAMSAAASYRSMCLAERGLAPVSDTLQLQALQLAQELHDDWLTGLAGLSRGWAHLQRHQFREAVNILQSARNLGHDLQQQHFIDMYIGLASYELRDLRSAARSWRDALLNAILAEHSRGMAGSIEGCAYLCLDQGETSTAFLLLNAAAANRRKTQVPLFSFWLPYHDRADNIAREKLGHDVCERLCERGAALRMEDATNLAFNLLQGFVASPA